MLLIVPTPRGQCADLIASLLPSSLQGMLLKFDYPKAETVLQLIKVGRAL